MALSQKKIWAAADEMAAKGLEVTQDSVREYIGEGGSDTTLNKHLRSWREQREREKATIASELSDADRERALLLVAGVHADIRSRFEDELARRISVQVRREAELEAEIDRAAEEAEALLASKNALQADLEAERSVREALRNRLTGADAKMVALVADNQILMARLEESEKHRNSLSEMISALMQQSAAANQTTPLDEEKKAS